VNTTDYLVAMGACAAAAASGHPAEGRRVAIEGFGPAGLALARLLADRGASVVALGTGAGTVEQPDGFDVAALGEAWAAAGDGLVKSIGTPAPAWKVFAADADVLFIGSKAGTLSHEGAEQVRAEAVVPIGPVPLTTKALLGLQRRGIATVPDFLSLAAPHLAGFSGLDDQRAAAEAATGAITEAVKEAAGHADGLFLGACTRAEAFLLTWQEKVPFGRPLA
jgi:glutamate dehydrogenase/leucine dehydrogenase